MATRATDKLRDCFSDDIFVVGDNNTSVGKIATHKTGDEYGIEYIGGANDDDSYMAVVHLTSNGEKNRFL